MANQFSLIFKDGVFDGMWSNGKRNGIGKMIFTNGTIYDGMWKNDKWIGVPGQTESQTEGLTKNPKYCTDIWKIALCNII